MDMKEYCFALVLLGRTFLVTTRALIDVDGREIVLHSGREYEIFRLSQLKHMPEVTKKRRT